MMPNSPSETIIAAMFPLRKEEMRSNPNASIVDWPARSRRSPHAMNATRETRVRAKTNGIGETSRLQNEGGVSLKNQPKVRPSMSPKTREAKSTTDSAAPTISTRPGVPISRDSRANTSTPMTMITPSGTLMPKAQRQEK